MFRAVHRAAEVGNLWLDRDGFENESFTGFYAYGSYFLTGETRAFRGGNSIGSSHSRSWARTVLGAFELALRYDQLDLSELRSSQEGARGATSTLWSQLVFQSLGQAMFNWIRFSATTLRSIRSH